MVSLDDDGKSDVTVTWTCDDPNVVFTPPTNTIAAGPASVGVSVATSLTCDYDAGTVRVTVTATDLNPVGTFSETGVDVYVANNPCAASRAGNGMDLSGRYVGDITHDCLHDYQDLAEIGKEWQLDFAIIEAQPDNR